MPIVTDASQPAPLSTKTPVRMSDAASQSRFKGGAVWSMPRDPALLLAMAMAMAMAMALVLDVTSAAATQRAGLHHPRRTRVAHIMNPKIGNSCTLACPRA